MTGVPRVVTQSYYRVVSGYYRLAESIQDYFNLSRRLNLLIFAIALLGSIGIAVSVQYEAWVGTILLMLVMVMLPMMTVYPELIVVGILLCVASVVSPFLWDRIFLGDRGITLPNLLISLGLVVVLFRHLTSKASPGKLWSSPSTIAIIAFLILTVPVGLLYHSLFRGWSIRSQLSEMEYMLAWLTFFIAIGIMRTERTLHNLQVGLLFVAGIGALATVLQALLGQRAVFFLRLAEWDIPVRDTEGLLRVLPPGQYLVLVSMVISAQMSTVREGPRRWGWIALTALYGLAIVFTLTRHSWFGAMLGLGLIWLFGSSRTKVNLLLIAFVTVAVVGSLTMFARPAWVTQPTDIVAKLQRRFISTFTEPPNRYTYGVPSSVGQRLFEMQYIMDRLPDSPWFGLGWGTKHPLRVTKSPYVGSTYEMRTYIHNSILWILGKGGIVGLVGLLVLLLTGTVRGYMLYKRTSPDKTYVRSWLLALWISWLMLLLAAQFEPVFWTKNRLVAPAMILALMEGLYYFGTKNTADSQASETQTR
jgi:hypothetical protein